MKTDALSVKLKPVATDRLHGKVIGAQVDQAYPLEPVRDLHGRTRPEMIAKKVIQDRLAKECSACAGCPRVNFTFTESYLDCTTYVKATCAMPKEGGVCPDGIPVGNWKMLELPDDINAPINTIRGINADLVWFDDADEISGDILLVPPKKINRDIPVTQADAW